MRYGTSMRRLASVPLAALLLCGPAGTSNAEETYNPAEDAAGLPRIPGAPRQPLTRRDGGVTHMNAFGKRCLEFQYGPRPHITNPSIADYVVTITNGCPQAIRVEICPKGSYDCTKVALRLYEQREAVLGSGPAQAGGIPYTARELP